MQPLCDPAQDRVVKQVPLPPHRPLDNDLMFPAKNQGKPDWKLIKEHLEREGRIAKKEVIKLVTMANKIFKNEGSLIHLSDPLTVVGDIHGQFYDFLKILDVGGNPESQKYVFLGDYVDRGPFSIEVLILLYSLKINYPRTIYMLRGNHECRQLTSFFNFMDECKYKYDQELYDVFMDSFDNLPLACIINNQFIALHGGISPELRNVADVNQVERFREPPKNGLFCDILWADPVDNDDGICEGQFRINEVRGCSYFYGMEAVSRFLERNKLISVIRAHEAQLEGYKMHRWDGGQDFPMVITIFSAPNYCDVYNNKGAVIKFKNNDLNIQQYNYSQHPYLLPNFMDIFTWSIPFVAEKVTEVLFHIIQPRDGEAIDEIVDEDDIAKFKELVGDQQHKNKDVFLKSKIKFVFRMMQIQKGLRQQSESLVQTKGACPDNRIPKTLLDSIKDSNGAFQTAKMADSINEKRPGLSQ
ncbi:unnamed protein product [Paramecium sonneborni]|uniref:Serine/threonine-protein phosphatase n=1 Tax=Paramecium sonneborni TaxID=65129 RepID=A0A8S1P7Z9_9CILI|nr:unnamed protein product [Paramecium sonneborni]